MTAQCVASSPTLTQVQLEIDRAGLLDAPASALLQLPTGSGKTFLARRAIHAALAHGYSAVYLCPLRAIARELYDDWQREFAGLGVYTGETGVDAEADVPPPAEARVLICTPEKFDAYLRQWQRNYAWLARIDLLVVDELHLLGDNGRGATLESVIARFRHLNPYLRVLGLSATLGNPGELSQWLGATAYRTDQRPIPLTWRIETFDAKGSGDRGKAALALQKCARPAQPAARSSCFASHARERRRLPARCRRRVCARRLTTPACPRRAGTRPKRCFAPASSTPSSQPPRSRWE